MTKFLIFILSISFMQCKSQVDMNTVPSENKRIKQDSIIKKYVTNCAEKFNYKYQMIEWQNCLDEGLKVDSTIAYLWQQKAMPYFKARKYEVGMIYLDKAVFYDSRRWLSYRAFIKCIFAKTYQDAIIDFEKCIDTEGNSYVMDHTYQFHIALCNLQLNQFKKAETIFSKDIEEQEKEWGEAHYLDLFYYGISKYEQEKWKEAIVEFDKSLKQYPNFSEVKYYKSICLLKLNDLENSKILYQQSKEDGINGHSINEDNSIYETYPYQVRW
ncbi:tetratricopeptide repeat protein [Mariniflexile soesokkakense]|uniref:Tetratricopeptide repeat protein n=1 Tax=Mariniflexile soesokkakense TaxID=1343160 RepID=A0ABV0ACN7_9FLAO